MANEPKVEVQQTAEVKPDDGLYPHYPNTEIVRAWEKEHGCKVVRSYNKLPPQEWQDSVVHEANTYYCISNARFDKNYLVADSCIQQGHGYESLSSMLDGLYRGACAILGKTKPYSITYTKVELRRSYKKYEGKTEREVYQDLNLDYYGDDKLPERMFKKTPMVEKFATIQEATARLEELRPTFQFFPKPEFPDGDHGRVVYNRNDEYHF